MFAYSTMNESAELTKIHQEVSFKHLILSASSVALGILPALLSRIISVTAQFFCSSALGGFRAGFLGVQAVLQGIETYPLLKLRLQQS